jgi:hypothetical protein
MPKWKWFLAAYLMGRDKRGVSAKFLQRELAVAYQTAWTMAHKLRHGLSEDPARPLRGFLEADETFIGGRGDPTRTCALVAVLGRCGGNSTDLTQGYDRNGHIPTPVYFAARAP